MNMTKEENRKLVERYPFLLPRNVWTGKVSEDYDYTHIRGIGEIPKGWEKVFLQMCEDIRQPLIDANYLEDFRFSQIKEKYNTMRCYHFGAPEKVQDIIDKYSVMTRYVCIRCGKPAIYKTQGYITSLCMDCWKDHARHYNVERIAFKPYYKVTGFAFANGEEYERVISFEDEWNKYLKENGYDTV